MNRIWARKKFKNRRVMLMNYWCNLEWSDWSKSYQTTAYTRPLAAASQAAVTLSAENITEHPHRGRSIAFYHNNLWAFDLPKSVSSSAPKSRQTSKGCPEWHSFTPLRKRRSTMLSPHAKGSTTTGVTETTAMGNPAELRQARLMIMLGALSSKS